jgi:heptosyltransferase-2
VEALMKQEKILFIQTAFLGDAILSLPAIQKLKEKYSDSVLDVLCIPSTAEVFKASENVDSVITLDKKGKHKSLLNTYRFVKQLKQNNYTSIYSSHRSIRTSLIVILLEVRESFGFNNAVLFHTYKNLIKYELAKHEVQRNFDLIGYDYDENSWRVLPIVNVSAETKEKIKLFISEKQIGNSFIAIAPGSVWNTKKYPLNYYENIIEILLKKNHKVVLIGGKYDFEECELISSNFDGRVINSAGNFSVIESIELLKYSALLITNDSAPTHMAMCANIKVITIYCSTIPEFGFYPYNKKSISISFNDLKCKPCGIHGYKTCPIKSFDCGIKVLPQDVITKVEEILSE